MTDLRDAARQALNSLRGYRRELGCQQPCDAERALEAALTEEALQRLTDVHQEIEAALEQPEPDYYLLPTNKKEPRPGLVNLEEFPGFLYESPNGWHIGDMKVVKWLLNNREADYWAQFKEKS
jgi:hypothetical protein